MNLLLADDDEVLAEALTAQLREAGFEIEHAPNGAVAEYLLLKRPFDLALLDLGLPIVDGLAVLRRVRAAKPAMPVLVMTARDSLDDCVAGLNAGADDYLAKPFHFRELEARIRALLRRARPPGNAAMLGPLSFERDTRRALLRGEPLELSPREWMLLDLLLSQRDKVVTKEQIQQAWALDRTEMASATNSIEVHIHRLRRKLEQSGVAIRTIRGLGYLLELVTERRVA